MNIALAPLPGDPVGRLGGIGVTRNETFGSSVASAAVMTADIDVTVTVENSREIRARLRTHPAELPEISSGLVALQEL